jgi:hypothetical protein
MIRMMLSVSEKKMSEAEGERKDDEKCDYCLMMHDMK